jgi:hypothetical protein
MAPAYRWVGVNNGEKLSNGENDGTRGNRDETP